MSSFIKVSEQLPPINVPVLVVCNGKVCSSSYCFHEENAVSERYWVQTNASWYTLPFNAVTHWFPLPTFEE